MHIGKALVKQVGDLPDHVWHIDGVRRGPFAISSHVGESSKISVLIGQPGALSGLEQPDLVYSFGQPHCLQQNEYIRQTANESSLTEMAKAKFNRISCSNVISLPEHSVPNM